MEKIEEKLEKILKLKVIVKILLVVGIILVEVMIFSLGIVVGFNKASYGHAFGDNYYKNLGIPTHRGFGMMDLDDLPNAHGAIGKIIKADLPTLIVQSGDNTEKIILIKDDTKMEVGRQEIMATDLAVDDFIVIIGSSNSQGQIEAKLIRVIPEPEF